MQHTALLCEQEAYVEDSFCRMRVAWSTMVDQAVGVHHGLVIFARTLWRGDLLQLLPSLFCHLPGRRRHRWMTGRGRASNEWQQHEARRHRATECGAKSQAALSVLLALGDTLTDSNVGSFPGYPTDAICVVRFAKRTLRPAAPACETPPPHAH